MSKFTLSSVVLAGLLSATHAGATDVVFTGFAHGSQTVQYTLSGTNAARNGSAPAGGFATSLNGGPSFESYCVDLYQTVTFNTHYPEYTGPGTTHVFNNGNAYTDLSRLYARAGVVANSVAEAAFQIAVWEIAYETSTNTYDLTSGDAIFFGGTANPAALTMASGWLTSLGAAGPAIQVLESGKHQDVIYAPVPEPETYAMLLAGLSAVGFMSRRQRRKGRSVSA